jgi:peptidoglycan/xylan/chitin deacetylase (PgdA/CDA1 family)
MNKNKILLANLVCSLKIDCLLLMLRCFFYKGNYIYALNYHSTPENESSALEQQLIFYKKYFSSVGISDLDRFFENRKWHKDKPGLILSFDDGLRSNFNIAVPLLEKYGFTGWFFIPTDFPGVPVDEQITFVNSHAAYEREDYKDGRITMTWNEIQQLDKKHVIGCHTKTHHRMVASTSKHSLHQEIIVSKRILEEKLGHAVNIFCWVGGEELSYSAQGAQAIREATYKYSFMTNCMPITIHTNPLQLQRYNVETSWPINLVKFAFSGILDLLYIPKRKRVNNLTSKQITFSKMEGL